MRVLVTGARGFLGERIVRTLGERGHAVRALHRPRAAAEAGACWPGGVEEVLADLCDGELSGACRGVDVVIHLAVRLSGTSEELRRSAVDGTRRLLDAMDASGVPRLALASSLSVYDWSSAAGALDEGAALEPRPEARDGYTAAKLAQERLARERCAAAGRTLTVLRPGFLWGPGREEPPTAGLRLGPLRVLVEPGRQLPLVHVDNCADAFAAVVDAGAHAAGTFNVVDDPYVTVEGFERDRARRTRRGGLALRVPYRAALGWVTALHRLTPRRLRARLPSFASPERFVARFKPVRVDAARLRDVLGWQPRFSYEECLDRTFGAGALAGA